MVTRLKNLNESLDRLYDFEEAPSLNESLITEAYNDSFPDWLKDRLTAIRSYHGEQEPGASSWGDVYKKTSPRNIRTAYPGAFQQSPDYSTPRGEWDTPKLRRKNSLFQGALDTGIDFQNTEVHEGPIPEKRTDTRLKAPNIPIWGFENGQVYIPGVNDNEINQLQALKGTTYANYAFKYIPFKHLLANAVHFAYIDGSTLDPNSYFDKKANRTATRDSIKGIKDPTAGAWRRKHDPKQFKPSGISQWSIDKSGYPINPDRYKHALMTDKRVYKAFDKRYNDLLEAREDIIAALSYYDSFENPAILESLNNCLVYLRYNIVEYNSELKKVDNYVEMHNDGTISDNDFITYMTNIINDLDTYSYWHRLQKEGAQIFLAGVDWLE